MIARPDEKTGESPVAFVVARGPVEPGQLMAWVAARVAPHKRIRAVRLVSEIPRNPSGKILRRALIEADRAAQGHAARDHATPDHAAQVRGTGAGQLR